MSPKGLRHCILTLVRQSARKWLLRQQTQLIISIKHWGQTILTTVVNTDRMKKHFQHRSPVTRLPPEILICIFKLYIPSFEDFLNPDGMLSHGPFCLVQVCTLWRIIVESLPTLWTSIRLYFPELRQSRKDDAPRIQLVFDLHLKRSGALPISLTFADQRAYHSSSENLISLLVDRLRTHAQRWERISLQLAGDYFPLLFTFTPCDLSSLKDLCINSNTVVFTCPVTLHLDLKSATNLRSFNYSGPGPSVEDNIRLPWEQLADVAFEFSPHHRGNLTVMSFRRLIDFAQCRNITTCSLGIDRPPPFGRSRTIVFPCLRTLHVRRLSLYARASGLIDPLVLPQLQTLEIDSSNLIIGTQLWHNRTFSDLLARSECSLLRLSIQDVDLPSVELMRCFILSPALVSFRFIPCPRSHDIRDIIREMDVSRTAMSSELRLQVHGQGLIGHSGPLVPQLREITLASSVEGYMDDMMAMFRSRVGPHAGAAGVTTLRRAQVVFFDLWHDMDTVVLHGSGKRDRRENVASFGAVLKQWSSEDKNRNRNLNGNGNRNGEENENRLEVSVIVDSPYLPGYIDVR